MMEKAERIRAAGVELRWDPDRGTATFESLPVIMMWVDSTLAGLMSGVQAMVGTERFGLALQSEGRKSVEADWALIERFPDFRDGFRAIAGIAAAAGWGRWTLISLDSGQKECRFRVVDSWEGRYQKALGVCWGSAMLAGKLAGYCSRLFGCNCWAEQTAFSAAGAPYDEFAVRPSDRSVEKEIKNLLRSDAATRADMAAALRKLEKEIDDRLRAEQALRDSEDWLRSILDSVHVGVLIVEAETHRIVSANPRALEMIGAPLEEVAGKPCHRFVCPAGEGRCPLSEGTSREVSERILLAAGTRTLPVLKSVVRTRIGGVVYLVESFVDISDRKKAEEELQEREARLHSIFRAAPIGIGLLVDRVFKDANQRLCEMVGYAKEELIGRSARLLYVDEEEFERVGRVKYAQIRERGTGTIESTWRCRDGRLIEVLLSSTPLDPADWSAGITFTALDITERVRAAKQRLELERSLLHTQKLESLGVLAGGIAHDFNNLLLAISGNLDLALLNLPEGSSARSDIEHAIQAARKAAELTREMLAYSGKGSFLVTRLGLNELVQENIQLFRSAKAGTNSLQLELSPEEIFVDADPGQIQQVVMNLISNASEALAGSSGSITVGTGARFCDGQLLQASRLEEKPPPGQYAFLEVRDTGCGMDSETQARLFDPFFTTKVAGRGLGMSAVLGIVRGHGGAILVGSELGSGTTVQVLLPRREQPVPKARRTEAAFPAGVAAANPWVLVVDDEASVRKLCMIYLKKLGLHVLGAAGGKEALELVGTHRERLACVLLDLTMPSMDGSAVFEEIRRLAPSLPVVLSSGYSRQEAVKRFSREDLAGFIQKPFRLKELKEAILPLLSR